MTRAEIHKRYNDSPAGRLRSYKSRCKLKGIEWALTDEQALELFEMPCRYCGDVGHGIDRVDNFLGYVTKNVVPCCSMCNFMKNKISAEDFLKHVAKVTAYQASIQLFNRVKV